MDTKQRVESLVTRRNERSLRGLVDSLLQKSASIEDNMRRLQKTLEHAQTASTTKELIDRLAGVNSLGELQSADELNRLCAVLGEKCTVVVQGASLLEFLTDEGVFEGSIKDCSK